MGVVATIRDRRGDAECAFHDDVPHGPEARDGQREAEHLHPLSLADDRQEEREREERELDDETPSKREGNLGDSCEPDEHRRQAAERPERLPGRGHDREDEEHGRRDLALGCQAVDGAVAVHRQRLVVARASGRGPGRRRTHEPTPPNSAAARRT